MIAVVDYGAGNVTSVRNALLAVGCEALITANPADIAAAERVVFPGVGAAGSAMENLHRTGLGVAIRNAVEAGKPVLGICVGLQVLFDKSEEDSGTPCLGLLPGEVIRFRDQPGRKIPHMGWNRVGFLKSHPVFEGIPSGTEFYFVHSYHPSATKPEHVLAVCEYGLQSFHCTAGHDNLLGVQFHAEKSGDAGLRLLRNFTTWNGRC